MIEPKRGVIPRLPLAIRSDSIYFLRSKQIFFRLEHIDMIEYGKVIHVYDKAIEDKLASRCECGGAFVLKLLPNGDKIYPYELVCCNENHPKIISNPQTLVLPAQSNSDVTYQAYPNPGVRLMPED